MAAAGTCVFRVDASPAIGGGHVMRCLALADAVAERGWRSTFACRDGTVETVPALGRSGHRVLTLTGPPESEPAALAERCAEGADLLAVDHYGRDADFERACRPWAKQILVIDDLADRTHDCNVLIDQTLDRRARDYEGLVLDSCRLLLGPSYALLRPGFAAAREKALGRRAKATRVGRILVSIGATDPHNLTAVALTGIQESGVDAEVDVVVGPADRSRAAIESGAAKSVSALAVYTDAEDMAGLMARADIAIGAAGSTSWERCCLGLPSLVVVAADNQRQIAAALERHEAAIVLGWHGNVTARKVAGGLAAICADPEIRSALSARAAEICDGRGASRLVEEVTH
jgi:UDP-2,4-diacetamido-2,4,6-trideoxy-beta-L-altropyranose hydrolase